MIMTGYNTMNFREKLYHKACAINIQLTEHQLIQFETFYHQLLEKNKVMNLTAITEEDQVISKHFIDSLTCSRIIDLRKTDRMIDVGTGAGFPGIPIKIAFPDINIVLIDSLNKRINFIHEVIDSLKLRGIDAVHGRAEDLAREKKYRESFDVCVSRAVASLRVLSEYCIPFIKPDGYFVSYKSEKGLQEIEESVQCMHVLGSEIDCTDQFVLPDSDSDRLLIRIKKNKKTPGKYPRRAGIPARDPL